MLRGKITEKEKNINALQMELNNLKNDIEVIMEDIISDINISGSKRKRNSKVDVGNVEKVVIVSKKSKMSDDNCTLVVNEVVKKLYIEVLEITLSNLVKSTIKQLNNKYRDMKTV